MTIPPISPFCNRCIYNANASTPNYAVAYGKPDAPNKISDDSFAARPRDFSNWVLERIAEGYTQFSIGSVSRALLAVTTWNGDPVCEWHLWILVDYEYRSRSSSPSTGMRRR